MVYNFWKEEDILKLKEIYPVVERGVLLETFAGRSLATIEAKARSFGLKRPNIKKAWSTEEDLIIKNCYSSSEKEDLLQNLPERTWRAIVTRAEKLEVSRNKDLVYSTFWSKEEELLLIEKYPSDTSREELVSLFNRSYSAIESKALKLGLNRPYQRDLWSEEELELLKKIYHNHKKDFIVSQFKGRTWKAIICKAIPLGLSRDKDIVNQENKESNIKTNLKRYNVEYSWQREEVKNKIKNSF